jgi:hypothetical protein
MNIVKYCAHMCVNGKMRPVETIPGMGGRGIEGNDGGGEFKCDIRIFVNVIMYSQCNNKMSYKKKDLSRKRK